MDMGRSGQEFRVQLNVAGRYRSVSWEKLDPVAVNKEKVGSAATYQIVANWNCWTPETMMAQTSTPGLFTYEVTLRNSRPATFNVLMNEDWDQMLYPGEFND